MGEHDDASANGGLRSAPPEAGPDADDAEDFAGDDVDERTGQRSEDGPSTVKSRTRKRLSKTSAALIVGVSAVAAVGAVAGWSGYRNYEDHQTSDQSQQVVAAARQGALYLTTIDYTTVDADIKRILDSSAGSFRDDFQKRSGAFIEAVKTAQSKSQGTVTEAALEAQDGDRAQVLVTVSMKTTSAAAPEERAQSWRMRIDIDGTGGASKMSDVQFVA
jgi:Mce-associated membrane protein